jgi:protoporphyrinogen oxidase
MTDTVILGGGLSGLSCAYHLKGSKERVTVLEANEELGGMLSSYSIDGGDPVERYYHHFFTGDVLLPGMVGDLGLGDRIEWFNTTTGYFIEEKLWRLSTPTQIMRFPHLSLADKVRLTRLVLKSKKINPEEYDDVVARDFIIKRLGEKCYENFFHPLLKSKFGENADLVSAAWLLSRVRIRGDRSAGGEKLGYLRGGFKNMVDAMAKKCGAEIKTRSPVTAIKTANGSVKSVIVGGREIKCDRIVATMPFPTLTELLDADLGLKDMRYQGAACFLLGLKESVSDTYWLNVKGDFPFGAVVEHTNLVPAERYGCNLVYLASYFQNEEDFRWKLPPEKLAKRFIDGLQQMFPSLNRGDVLWWKLSRDLRAGPIYDTGYRSRIPGYETSIRGLYTAGMSSPHNYPERSMEGSLVAGKHCAEIIVDGK